MYVCVQTRRLKLKLNFVAMIFMPKMAEAFGGYLQQILILSVSISLVRSHASTQNYIEWTKQNTGGQHTKLTDSSLTFCIQFGFRTANQMNKI